MDIRFLLDEDTEEQLATKLQKAGYDAVRVVNVDALGPGSDDTEVRDYARKTGRIIITYDDDLLSLDPDSHPGVFFLTTNVSPRTNCSRGFRPNWNGILTKTRSRNTSLSRVRNR